MTEQFQDIPGQEFFISNCKTYPGLQDLVCPLVSQCANKHQMHKLKCHTGHVDMAQGKSDKAH